MRHTDMRMDPRTRDLGALILCVLAIEGPRVMRVTQRRSTAAAQAKAERQHRANAAGGTIIDMDQNRPRPAGI
jgi:hypothetical protein